ncbi:hypothetical protein HK104_005790, partial [Borealophlyctis nickersoniae]
MAKSNSPTFTFNLVKGGGAGGSSTELAALTMLRRSSSAWNVPGSEPEGGAPTAVARITLERIKRIGFAFVSDTPSTIGPTPPTPSTFISTPLHHHTAKQPFLHTHKTASDLYAAVTSAVSAASQMIWSPWVDFGVLVAGVAALAVGYLNADNDVWGVTRGFGLNGAPVMLVDEGRYFGGAVVNEWGWEGAYHHHHHSDRADDAGAVRWDEEDDTYASGGGDVIADDIPDDTPPHLYPEIDDTPQPQPLATTPNPTAVPDTSTDLRIDCLALANRLQTEELDLLKRTVAALQKELEERDRVVRRLERDVEGLK